MRQTKASYCVIKLGLHVGEEKKGEKKRKKRKKKEKKKKKIKKVCFCLGIKCIFYS